MDTFIGTKIIEAEPQAKNYGPPETHGQPGWRIVYPDGYTSWSPAASFEEAYRKTSGMPFGLAIEALKKGKRVARQGWNGKGMWLMLVGQDDYGVYDSQDVSPGNFEGKLLAWVGMQTAQGDFVPWLASQSDMLADDWAIVE